MTESKRTPLELALMVGVVAFTTLFAAGLVAGVPVLLVWRALEAGASAGGVVWGVLAAVWIGALGHALVRDRETRGWILLALVGWISYLGAAWRRLVPALRRQSPDG